MVSEVGFSTWATVVLNHNGFGSHNTDIIIHHIQNILQTICTYFIYFVVMTLKEAWYLSICGKVKQSYWIVSGTVVVMQTTSYLQNNFKSKSNLYEIWTHYRKILKYAIKIQLQKDDIMET